MIDVEIQALFFKLLLAPAGFTLIEMRELERLLDLYHRAKSMGLELDLVDDQQMVSGEVIV